jgi:hypothetical protein
VALTPLWYEGSCSFLIDANYLRLNSYIKIFQPKLEVLTISSPSTRWLPEGRITWQSLHCLHTKLLLRFNSVVPQPNHTCSSKKSVPMATSRQSTFCIQPCRSFCTRIHFWSSYFWTRCSRIKNQDSSPKRMPCTTLEQTIPA